MSREKIIYNKLLYIIYSVTHREVFMHDVAYNGRRYPALEIPLSRQKLSNNLTQQQLKHHKYTP